MTLEVLIERIGEIRAATATDVDLRSRFITDPMALMSELGVDFPPGVVLETGSGPEGGPAAATLKFPMATLRFPIEAEPELSGNMLDNVVGGAYGGGFFRSGGWGQYNYA